MQVEVLPTVDSAAVFRHASALQEARSYAELGRVTAAAVGALTRYRHSWLALLEPEDPTHARILQVSGSLAEVILEKCPRVPVAGDEMMRELLERRGPVVVEDARTDPRTNKAIVEALGNRTIINVPLAVADAIVGSLGAGTFGDEGTLPPTREELDALVVFSVQLGAAIERVRAQEREQAVERERATLERRLASLQRVELMGVLASGVAHDLNNLLMVLSSSVELLSFGPDPETLRDARSALRRAAAICNQLLALGRRGKSLRERVDLDEHLEGSLRLVRPTLPRGVTLEHTAVAHPQVLADPTQVDQALANLLLNARDAVGEHGRIVASTDEVVFQESDLDSRRWARAGRFTRVVVEDDGVGVPPELLERIFEPLVTTKPQGTGLGLAVVASVVQQHEGLVHCESAPGQTRFELYFPAAPG